MTNDQSEAVGIDAEAIAKREAISEAMKKRREDVLENRALRSADGGGGDQAGVR